MKAVWLNTVGEVFEIFEDADRLAVKIDNSHFMPGDTIKFVEDDDDTFKVGGHYSAVAAI